MWPQFPTLHGHEAFAGLFTLTHLSLANNELQFFPTETMTRLPVVTCPDLSSNLMIFLGRGDGLHEQTHPPFHGPHSPSLTHLDLSHNQLRYLQPSTPASPKLTLLNLAGNPIYCNCYLLPLREYGIRKKVKLMGACGRPAHFSGENLEAIHFRDLRCQSQEAMLKAEFEEQTRGIPTPTPEPTDKVKCPANCACKVRDGDAGSLIWSCHL
uniref:LRRCT domain-containing protein n=1 Tax=Hucho hucho TaxID=62062 RepID=A0A4W5QT18_9TELE